MDLLQSVGVNLQLSEQSFSVNDVIETTTGIKLSRKSFVVGNKNVTIIGKAIIMEGVVMRGDMCKIKIDRYCIIAPEVVLRPPFKRVSGGALGFIPLEIGSGVIIGARSVVSAALIESGVVIGQDCVIGRLAVLKSGCVIADGTYVPPEMVVPPLAVARGNPARIELDILPDASQEMLESLACSIYYRFDKLKRGN